jgi:outer membrane cobalamin receptor
MSQTIEEERDEWLRDHQNARVIHSFTDERRTEKKHCVVMNCQDYDDTLQKESRGVGNSYSEALLVALRNWQAEWGWRELTP